MEILGEIYGRRFGPHLQSLELKISFGELLMVSFQ
ncbi:hypothetical protein OROGR_005961 [Orobanche gracilis]